MNNNFEWNPNNWSSGSITAGLAFNGATVDLFGGGSIAGNSFIAGRNISTGIWGGGSSSFGQASYSQMPSAGTGDINWGLVRAYSSMQSTEYYNFTAPESSLEAGPALAGDAVDYFPGNGGGGGSEEKVAAVLAGAAVISIGEPTPIGEIITGVGTLAATLYYGPQIVDKMQQEISRVMAKQAGPPGVQYSLRAKASGSYPCYRCNTGNMYLSRGAVWKYGQTTNPFSRYSDGYLNAIGPGGVRQVNEVWGSQRDILIAEKIKIYGYFFTNGHLPPGNRIFR